MAYSPHLTIFRGLAAFQTASLAFATLLLVCLPVMTLHILQGGG